MLLDSFHLCNEEAVTSRKFIGEQRKHTRINDMFTDCERNGLKYSMGCKETRDIIFIFRTVQRTSGIHKNSARLDIAAAVF